MNKFVSKVQYKNCEQGEFYESKERSFEDLIHLVKHFPWEEQREDLKVDLTNPCIVIEISNDTFLQLALYYNGKFVLRFVDGKDQLFTLSLTKLEDADLQFRSLYHGLFSTNGFKKETTWFKKNRLNFISQSFNYSVDSSTAFKYLWRTTGSNIILYLLFLASIFTIPTNNGGFLWILILVFFILVVGINLIIFTNHYLTFKGRILQVSKGNSNLYFGDNRRMTKYSKSEISEIVIIHAKNIRSPFNGFYVYKIKFKSGEILRLSNIFVAEDKMIKKFYDCKCVERGGFAII